MANYEPESHIVTQTNRVSNSYGLVAFLTCSTTFTMYHLLPITVLNTTLYFFFLVQAGDALIQLYNHFISDFETKINLLKFAHFAVVVSRQYSDKDAGINYLEGVILKLRDTQEARIEEPILYVKMQIATFLLEKGSQKECKKLLDEGKITLDSMVDVDPSVHATYYWICSQYHKAHQDYSEFYKSALLYLAYTTVESLSEPFKQVLLLAYSLDTTKLDLFLPFLISSYYLCSYMTFRTWRLTSHLLLCWAKTFTTSGSCLPIQL